MIEYNVSTGLATPVIMKWSAGRRAAEMQAHPDDQMFPPSSSLNNVQFFLFRVGSQAQTLKLSPQPHIPLMLGLLNMNSLVSFVSTKSISVPRRVSWAFFSMNTLTPRRWRQPSFLPCFHSHSTVSYLFFYLLFLKSPRCCSICWCQPSDVTSAPSEVRSTQLRLHPLPSITSSIKTSKPIHV